MTDKDNELLQALMKIIQSMEMSNERQLSMIRPEVERLVGIIASQRTELSIFDLEGHANIVAYVLQERYGGSLTSFAHDLTMASGHYVTRQKIDGWRVRGQFPVDWVETVQTLTKVPLRALMQRTKPLPR